MTEITARYTAQRIIKFRAFHRPTKRMVDVLSFDPYEVIVTKDGETRIDSLPREECVLLEFTGLTDKNGREIYEGDILQEVGGIAAPTARRLIVKWRGPRFIVELPGVNGYRIPWPIYPAEVIGNIHENPELVK